VIVTPYPSMQALRHCFVLIDVCQFRKVLEKQWIPSDLAEAMVSANRETLWLGIFAIEQGGLAPPENSANERTAASDNGGLMASDTWRHEAAFTETGKDTALLHFLAREDLGCGMRAARVRS
jgi:hypothetical protein